MTEIIDGQMVFRGGAANALDQFAIGGPIVKQGQEVSK